MSKQELKVSGISRTSLIVVGIALTCAGFGVYKALGGGSHPAAETVDFRSETAPAVAARQRQVSAVPDPGVVIFTSTHNATPPVKTELARSNRSRSVTEFSPNHRPVKKISRLAPRSSHPTGEN